MRASLARLGAEYRGSLIREYLRYSLTGRRCACFGSTPVPSKALTSNPNSVISFTMEGQNQNDELYPIAVLIDELKVVGD